MFFFQFTKTNQTVNRSNHWRSSALCFIVRLLLLQTSLLHFLCLKDKKGLPANWRREFQVETFETLLYIFDKGRCCSTKAAFIPEEGSTLSTRVTFIRSDITFPLLRQVSTQVELCSLSQAVLAHSWSFQDMLYIFNSRRKRMQWERRNKLLEVVHWSIRCMSDKREGKRRFNRLSRLDLSEHASN